MRPPVARAPAVLPRTGRPTAAATTDLGLTLRPYALATIFAAVTCAAILFVHRQSPRTLVSAHGLLHAAIAERFSTAASILSGAPENPFFAGERLPYYWFFHWVGARVSEILHVNPVRGFEILTLASVLLAWLAGAAIGRLLFRGLGASLSIGFLVFAGANALGALLLLLKSMQRGSSVLHDDPNYLWGIAHPALGLARVHDPHSLYGPLLVFFFNTTSRPVALALLVLVVLALVWWTRYGDVTSWIVVALSTAVCCAFSPLIGLPAAVALAAGTIVAAFLRIEPVIASTVPAPLPRHGGAAAAVAALLVGALLASPTYFHLFVRTGEASARFAPDRSAFLGTFASALPLASFAALGLATVRGEARRLLVAVTVAAGLLVVLAVCVQLPVENDVNFFHAGALLLAVPAAGALTPVAGRSRAAATALAATALIVFLPTAALSVWAFTNRPTIALDAHSRVLHRLPEDAPWARVYTWVRDHSDPDAVFVLDPRPPLPSAVGNAPEFPALAGRVLFTAHASSYLVAPNADAPLRVALSERLARGEPLDEAGSELLAKLERPVYLVLVTDDAALLERAVSAHGAPEFGCEGAAVFRLIGE